MNLKDLKQEHKLFEVVAGSHAYGTNVPESDVDVRGIFMVKPEVHLSLRKPVEQVSDTTNDVTFYELKRYMALAADVNPNIVELLFTPEDCVKHKHPAMELLLKNRHLFISKKAYHTFSGYAYAQIKRAKGRNKWVNNPAPKDPPSKLDFCWFVDVVNIGYVNVNWDNSCSMKFPSDKMPCRPVSLKDAGIDLSDYNVAKMERMENVYRLYEYEERAKGVFRGPNQQLVVESIPIDDEWFYFAGLLIFNEDAYNAALRDWKNYWDWVKNRNEARWVDQESGKLDYDAKNLMHCMRLLLSGGNILKNGEPIVRFEGEQLKLLMDIRNGKFQYDELMEMVEEKKAELDELKGKSVLREAVDLKKIDGLFMEIMEKFWNPDGLGLVAGSRELL